MQTNTLPRQDSSDNPDGCCLRLHPKGLDDKHRHFEDKLFMWATTKSAHHMPTTMGRVFERTFGAIEKAGAYDPDNTIVPSCDVSPSDGKNYNVTVAKLAWNNGSRRRAGLLIIG